MNTVLVIWILHLGIDGYLRLQNDIFVILKRNSLDLLDWIKNASKKLRAIQAETVFISCEFFLLQLY